MVLSEGKQRNWKRFDGRVCRTHPRLSLRDVISLEAVPHTLRLLIAVIPRDQRRGALESHRGEKREGEAQVL
jgi:hypothetical protein